MNATLKLNLIRALSVVMLLFSANILCVVLFAALAMSIGFMRGKELSILLPLSPIAILGGYVSSIILAFQISRGKFPSKRSYYCLPFILLGLCTGLVWEYSVQHQPDAKIGLLYGILEIPSLIFILIGYWQSKFKLIRRRA